MKPFADMWSAVAETCLRRYAIEVGNNARFVAETIYSHFAERSSFVYAECGVYRGSTLLPVYHLCEVLFSRFQLYALDSFAGFPEGAGHEKDHPRQFDALHALGRITKQHREAARVRCAALEAPDQHLQSTYFRDYNEVFDERIASKPNIIKIPCAFGQLGQFPDGYSGQFDLVFLDCDLYASYWDCLRFFEDRTNLFIFDEYYSLKYPGARIACDEFMASRTGWDLFSKTEDSPYFERWGMKKR